MRLILTVVSVILLLLGGLWAVQGVGMVGGSFMTGSPQWLYIGLATAAIGLIGLVISRRWIRF